MGECYISNRYRLLVKILFENIKTWEVGNGINVSCCSILDYVFGFFLGEGELFLVLVSLVFLFCLFVCFMMATEFELMKNQYVGCR